MNPTVGMFVGDDEVERRLYGRRCQHGLPITAQCNECEAQAEFEERIMAAADQKGNDNDQ